MQVNPAIGGNQPRIRIAHLILASTGLESCDIALPPASDVSVYRSLIKGDIAGSCKANGIELIDDAGDPFFEPMEAYWTMRNTGTFRHFTIQPDFIVGDGLLTATSDRGAIPMANPELDCLATDTYGQPRLGDCDIGSYEHQ